MKPKHPREIVSRAISKWLGEEGVHTGVIDPGKLCQNGANESFDGTFRGKCFSMEWLRSRAETRVVIESFRRHYNAIRPFLSLEKLTPNEYEQELKPEQETGTGLDV